MITEQTYRAAHVREALAANGDEQPDQDCWRFAAMAHGLWTAYELANQAGDGRHPRVVSYVCNSAHDGLTEVVDAYCGPSGAEALADACNCSEEPDWIAFYAAHRV